MNNTRPALNRIKQLLKDFNEEWKEWEKSTQGTEWAPWSAGGSNLLKGVSLMGSVINLDEKRKQKEQEATKEGITFKELIEKNRRKKLWEEKERKKRNNRVRKDYRLTPN